MPAWTNVNNCPELTLSITPGGLLPRRDSPEAGRDITGPRPHRGGLILLFGIIRLFGWLMGILFFGPLAWRG
jgi:hypothetical protein